MNEIAPAADWTAQEPAPAPEHYHIEATKSLVDRTLRTLKHDELFGVFDNQGECRAGPGGPDGLYHQDTRFLSGLTMRIGGMEPRGRSGNRPNGGKHFKRPRPDDARASRGRSAANGN